VNDVTYQVITPANSAARNYPCIEEITAKSTSKNDDLLAGSGQTTHTAKRNI